MDINKIKEAIANNVSLTNIGIFLSFLLILNDFINEWSFVVLIIVFLYRDTLETLDISWRGLKMTRNFINVTLAKVGISFEAILPNFASVEPDEITDETLNVVIKSIGNTEYAWRHLKNIAEDSGLSLESTENKLTGLIEHGYAVESEKDGYKVYGLSYKGQSIFSCLIKK